MSENVEYTEQAQSPAELVDLSAESQGEEGVERVDMDAINKLMEKTYGSEQPSAEAEDVDPGPEELAEAESSADENDDFIEVDEDIYGAAKNLGLTDEQILDIHEKSPELLEHFRSIQLPPTKQEPQTKAEPEQRSEDPKPAIEFTEEQIEALKKAGLEGPIKALAEKANRAEQELNALRGRSMEEDQQREMLVWRERLQVADKKMDEWAKINPRLGAAKDLPRSKDGGYLEGDFRVQERGKLFKTAHALFQGGAADSWEGALDMAWAAYLGQNPKLIQQQVVTEINSRKKKFSPRPSKKSAKPAEQDFESQMMSHLAAAINRGSGR